MTQGWQEPERLRALARYQILDTPPEQAFDDIVKLATSLLATAVGAVNLIDSDRQWFKAGIGLRSRQTPLDHAICAYAMSCPDGLVVPDIAADSRFDGDLLVIGVPKLQFYAAEPLIIAGGMAVGTLCVADPNPRPEGLSEQQRFTLKTLARQVVTQLDLRLAVLERDTALAKQLRDRTREAQRTQRLVVLSQASAGLLTATDPDDVLGPLLEQSLGMLGYDQSYSYVIDPDGAHLTLSHSTGMPPRAAARLVHTKLDATLCGLVAKARQPLLFTDIRNSGDPSLAPGRQAGLNTLAGFPIIADGHLYGVLSFSSFERSRFEQEEVAFFGTLASYLAAVRHRLRSEAILHQLTATLAQRVEARTQERDMIWRSSRDLFVTYGADGVFRSANPAWQTLGYNEDEMLGLRFESVVHPNDLKQVRLHNERLASQTTDHEFDVRMRNRAGGYRLYSWYCVPAADEFYAAGRDITERQQLEEQLRQSQKMEAVGQLTGGLAHDFNNLLAGISGSLELMRMRVNEGRIGELDRYIGGAIASADRAAALTHRLLAFSRRQTLDSRPTDVAQLANGMQDLIQRTAGPGIKLQIAMADDLWTALCDPNQLENALLNLAINARDAMPEGGLLTVEAVNTHLDALYAASQVDVLPGAYIAISVSDNGAGMAAATTARVFDPFFTTKPLGEGTGLGLSMVYGFVKQSGGHIRVYSELDAGTTIKLYLPRHDGDAAAVVSRDTPATAPYANSGETVLVVDDEELVRMLVVEVLADLGYAALQAADAKEALTHLRSGHRIDLLVTDVGLPGGMNGRQLADACRQQRPRLPVLFITGYAETAVVTNGHLDAGMAVITKPFQMDLLMSTISRIIATVHASAVYSG